MIMAPKQGGFSFALPWVSAVLVCFFLAVSAHAKSPKPIVTASGKKISSAEVSRRLHRLLRELGEPRWSSHELNRLTRSVSAYLRAFTGRQYVKTLAALRRGDRYRPMIRGKLARAGLPLAFEALPMAESAFRFDARSRSGARGLWQYMPASARHYGLKVGRRVDQRTDPARATDAAVKYLKFLNRKFARTSVLLTIAAYNAGEGRIARVIRKSGVKGRRRGYSHVLRYLPRETRGYVPEFLAAALILKDPAYFGFPAMRERKYRYVQVRDPLSVRKLASLAGMQSSRLLQLNPELRRYRRTPTSNYFVRLPSKAARRLDRRLASAKLFSPVMPQISLTTLPGRHVPAAKEGRTRLVYEVKRGNNLGSIAEMFGVSVRELRQVNHLRGNRIVAGQRLIIPGHKAKSLVRRHYRVRRGDNLGRIARRLGIPVKHLMFVNGVRDPRRLRPGQRLFYYAS